MTTPHPDDELRDVEPIEGRPWISPISTPSRRVRVGIAVVAALAIIGVAVPLFISLLGGGNAPTGQSAPSATAPASAVAPSAEPMYSQPGDCIALTVTDRGATPRAASCTATDFTFIVATALPTATADCGPGQYSQLTQPGFGKLCIVPNLVAGMCYSVPSPQGTIADFRAVGCTAPVGDRAQRVRVQGRAAAATVDCPAGQVVSFERPSPLSYCLTAAGN